MIQRLLIALLSLTVLLSAAGCASTKVERVELDEQIDVSGRWNDTDSQMVSKEMVEDCVTRPWLESFVQKQNGRVPVVIVGTVRNQSLEHINTQTFIKDLERSLINSGKVDFVAARTERSEVRDERVDQAKNAREDTAKEQGMEIGADYMLQGSINAIEDREKKTRVMYYQVNLELIDIESTKKVWIGEKKIKKYITQSRFGL